MEGLNKTQVDLDNWKSVVENMRSFAAFKRGTSLL